MDVHVRDSGAVAIVEAPHRITATHGAHALRRRLEELIDSGRHGIVVDLAQTKYADSFGLAELAASYKQARQRKATVAFHCPKGRLRDLLNVTRLDDVFPIHEDETSAIAAVRGAAGAAAPPSGSKEPNAPSSF